MTLNNKLCKKLDHEKTESVKLKTIANMSTVELRTETRKQNLQLIKRYYTMCFQNKKQAQRTDPTADRKLVLKHAGTNKGASRIPYATISNRRVAASGPGTIRGGRALKFSLNNHRTKMPTKQKRLAIKLLFYYLFKESELYLIPETQITNKQFYKCLDKNAGPILKKALTDKKNLVLIMNDQEKTTLNYFKNYSCTWVGNKKKNYYGLINGFYFKKPIFFTAKALSDLLSVLK